MNAGRSRSQARGDGQAALLARADTAAFPHLDLKRYDAFKTAIQKHGFGCLGDFQDLAKNRAADSLLAPTILRMCASRDGQVVLAYYQAKTMPPQRWHQLVQGLLRLRWISAIRNFKAQAKARQCVEIQTEFNDGGFLITTNSPHAREIGDSPKISSDFHSSATPLPRLLDAHLANLGVILHAGRRAPLPVTTAEAMLNMQKRLAALRQAAGPRSA
jgi:hypothetical protein